MTLPRHYVFVDPKQVTQEIRDLCVCVMDLEDGSCMLKVKRANVELSENQDTGELVRKLPDVIEAIKLKEPMGSTAASYELQNIRYSLMTEEQIKAEAETMGMAVEATATKEDIKATLLAPAEAAAAAPELATKYSISVPKVKISIDPIKEDIKGL